LFETTFGGGERFEEEIATSSSSSSPSHDDDQECIPPPPAEGGEREEEDELIAISMVTRDGGQARGDDDVGDNVEIAVTKKSGGGKSTGHPARSTTHCATMVGDIRKDGLRSDTTRYLRMNQKDRQELNVPILGVVGPAALGGILFELHEDMSRWHDEVDAQQTGMINDVLFTSIMHENKVSKLANSTLHLNQANLSAITRDACNILGKRMVYDIGSPAGSEFDHSRDTTSLCMAVLRRARDTLRGIIAVNKETLSLVNPSLRDAMRSIITGSPPRRQVSIRRTLSRLIRSRLNLRRYIVKIPWSFLGALLNSITGRRERGERPGQYTHNAFDYKEWADVNTELAGGAPVISGRRRRRETERPRTRKNLIRDVLQRGDT